MQGAFQLDEIKENVVLNKSSAVQKLVPNSQVPTEFLLHRASLTKGFVSLAN